jgi:gliding motility-associated-like protein
MHALKYIFALYMLLMNCIYTFATHINKNEPTAAKPIAQQNTIQFEENKNQLPKQVKYSAPLFRGGKVYFENNTFTYQFWDAEGIAHLHHPSHDENVSKSPKKPNETIEFYSYKAQFLGANSNVQIEATQKESFIRNYFLGNDSSHWASNVSVFNRIKYKALYNGIDVEVYNMGNNMEYDYIVSPGANVNDIKVNYIGQKKINIINGDLQIKTSLGLNTETKPIAFQWIDGRKHMVACQYQMNEQNIISFNFPNGYNKEIELIIDPTLICSGYSGSTADNWAYTATYDAAGNIFSGGIVTAIGYPTTVGAYQTTFGLGGTGGNNYPFDICLTKYNPTGSNMIYSTYLGGNNNEHPSSIYTDANDNLFILGKTYSANFPVTAGSYDNSLNGQCDITVSKLNAAGTNLMASTFVGGSDEDGVNISAVFTQTSSLKYNYADDSRGDIMLDVAGNCYISSCTKSTNFPATAGAFQTSFQGGVQDGCVFKMSNDLSTMQWATYLGGSGDDAAYYLDIDPNQNVYVTGGTSSSNFPVTGGAFNQTYGGQIDGFLTRIQSNGANIMQSTFIGTPQYDQSYFVQLDKDFDVYICGQTTGNYGHSAGVYNNPNSGQFIHKFSPDLSTSIYHTVFGSGPNSSGIIKPNISPTAFLVDDCENVYVSGWGGQCIPYGSTGTTTGLPVTPDAIKSTTDGCDFYFIVLKKDALSLWYGSFYGGNTGSEEHVDGGTSRFDKKGIVYQSVCAGCGGLDNFPTTPGVYSSTNNSSNCNIGIIKMDFQLLDLNAAATAAPTDTVCSNYPISFNNNSTGAMNFIWDFGDGSPISNTPNPSHIYNVSGVYTVTLIAIDSLSCNFADTSEIEITVIIEPISGLGNDTIICGLTSIPIIAGNAAYTYLWNTGETSPVIIANSPGDYSVTINNGYCSLDDTLSIIMVTIPPIGNDTSVCRNQVVTLDAGNPGCTYLWNTGETTQTIEVPYSGTYWVMASAGNCLEVDSIEIIFLPLPQFSLGLDTIICPGDTLQLDAGNNGITFLWSSGTTNQYYDVTETGIFWAEAYTAQCSYKDTIKVEYYHQPELGIDTVLCSHEKFKLDLSFADPGGTYLWNTGATTSFLYVFDPGEYSVILTYNNTCNLYDTIEVTALEDDPPLFVPNSFTPNGDGLNDVFSPAGNYESIIDFYMAIYNRWGKLIFETRNKNNGWDGIIDNETIQLGVYIYRIDYRSFCSPDKTLSQVGHVALIR